MNTKEKIEVMQAWDAGEPLQVKDYNDEWLDFPTDSEPTWNWDNCDYRIKSKPQVVWIAPQYDVTHVYHSLEDIPLKYRVDLRKFVEVVED